MTIRPVAIDPITRTAGLAVVCAVAVQHLSSSRLPGQESDVISEALCWIILPILFAFTKRSDAVSTRFNLDNVPGSAFAPSSSLWSPGAASWVVALAVATACCFKAEIGPIGIFPALTPLVLIAEKHLQSREWHYLRTLDSTASYPLVDSVTFTALVALVSTIVLLDGNTVVTALSAIPAAALFIVFAAFIPRTSPTDARLKLLPGINNLDAAIGPLSVRIVILLAIVLSIQLFLFGLPSDISITNVLLLGAAKAWSWYFTIYTIRDSPPSYHKEDHERDLRSSHGRFTPWTLATLIGTFGLVATRDPSVQSSDLQAMSQVFVSAITLWQIIGTLSKQARSRSKLWVLVIFSIIPYLYNIHVMSSLDSSMPRWSSTLQHPADALIQQAKDDFDQMLARQSRTYSDAVQEYERRYGIPPPPGFDKWYEFAVANNSPIIDEFDTIFENISPFLRLSGKEVKMIMDRLRNIHKAELWDCSFTSRGAKAMTQCTHPYRSFDRHISNLLDQMIKDLDGIELPDVRFLVNHFDEPRVMLPLDKHDLSVQVTELSRKPTWNTLTQECSSPNRTLPSSWPKYPSVQTYSLPIVTDRLSDLDICLHPEYSTMNGLLMSPTSLRLISGLAPVLSTGAPLAMGDILIPSPAYSESGFQYDPASDIPWSQKQDNLYWAGSTTGGFVTSKSHLSFQRQRFVALAQNLAPHNKHQQHTYLTTSSTPSTITPLTTTTLNPRHFSASFTHIFQCTPPLCRIQRAIFPLKSWSPSNTPLLSKLTFDIDGNGISGRWYKLLASNSLPFKQTLLREWHDERVRPWVHYVPVSQGMGELAELVRWFLRSGRGRGRAEELARWGREWMGRGVREVDRSVYLFRLVLELGRVGDGGRGPVDV